jgi:dTDP-4-amino-4,6-dideoxygalactose transaminase
VDKVVIVLSFSTQFYLLVHNRNVHREIANLKMNIEFNKPFLAGKELYYIADAVMSGNTAGDGKYGKLCQKMLEEMIGYDCRVLLTTSCTAALEISAFLLDLEEGDEVILPSYTFVSTANAFCIRGAKPVFVDICPETLNIDLEGVKRAITPRTKAIVPVHYAGISCDMDYLTALAEAHSIPIIEDAAQAIRSSYKGRPLGSFGAMSTFSFHETKNINCGEGGALIVNNQEFFERAEIVREKGTNRSNFFRGYVDKYTWVEAGSSYALSDMLAAYLAAQLENIDQIQSDRVHAYDLYMKLLLPLAQRGFFRLPVTPQYNQSNAHMFYLIVENRQTRDALIARLMDRDIRAVFHYVPLHSSPYGQKFGYRVGDFPHTEDLPERLVRLPLYVSLADDEIYRVTNEIFNFFGQAKENSQRDGIHLAS